METKITQKFDLREAFTPFTFLKITQAFREMKVGEILKVTGSDPKTRSEVFQVLSKFTYTLIDTEESDEFYTVYLRKKNDLECL